MRAGAALPGELRRALRTLAHEPGAQDVILEHPAERVGERLGVAARRVQGAPAGNLHQRGIVAGHAGDAAGQSLEERQAEAFVAGRIAERGRAAQQWRQLVGLMGKPEWAESLPTM